MSTLAIASRACAACRSSPARDEQLPAGRRGPAPGLALLLPSGIDAEVASLHQEAARTLHAAAHAAADVPRSNPTQMFAASAVPEVLRRAM